jgi:transposase
VHRSAQVRARPAGRGSETEVFYLPPYGPDLDPDEGVDADLKQAVTREAPARSEPRLKRAVIGHVRKLSRSPARVRSLFGHRAFRHAA